MVSRETSPFGRRVRAACVRESGQAGSGEGGGSGYICWHQIQPAWPGHLWPQPPAAGGGRRGRDPPQTECKLQFPIFSSLATYSCPFQRLLSPFLGNISKLRILESVSVIHFPSILWHPSEVQYKRVGAKPRLLRGAGRGVPARQPTRALPAPCKCQLSNSNAGVAHTFNFRRALWL